VQGRYQGTLLGFGWTLVTPAMLFAVYGLVFGLFLQIDVPAYALFLLSGLLPWHWLAQSIEGAAESLAESGKLLTRVAVPPQVLPLAALLGHGVSFVLAFPVLLLAALAFGRPVAASLIAVPGIVIAQALFTAGLALPVAALCVVFRDIRHLAGTALQLWFLLTPIAYPPSLIPASLAPLAWLNPYFFFAQAYRAALYEGRIPSLGAWLAIAALALASLGAGILAFELLRTRAVEEL
jgi:ABC-type polysaccharide/polyol phosphate export permease